MGDCEASTIFMLCIAAAALCLPIMLSMEAVDIFEELGIWWEDHMLGLAVMVLPLVLLLLVKLLQQQPPPEPKPHVCCSPTCCHKVRPPPPPSSSYNCTHPDYSGTSSSPQALLLLLILIVIAMISLKSWLSSFDDDAEEPCGIPRRVTILEQCSSRRGCARA